jgi:hypothetical protein
MANKRLASDAFPDVDERFHGIPIEDAGDRAAKHKGSLTSRIPLGLIGFYPGNRGGLGMDCYHVHQVAFDIMINKLSVDRYGSVSICKIPAKYLQHVRAVNQKKAEDDEQAPKCSDNIEYVCITKTHCTHAMKLLCEGGRHINNTGDLLKFQANDAEAKQVEQNGPLCTIYATELYEDNDALEAVSSNDNRDANIMSGEYESHAFGKVHVICNTKFNDADVQVVELSSKEKAQRVKTVMDAVTLGCGLGVLLGDHWRDIIALRVALPSATAAMFIDLIFKLVGSRVRVKAEDYGLLAKLDGRCLLLLGLEQPLEMVVCT